jgi:hypothetical protein
VRQRRRCVDLGHVEDRLDGRIDVEQFSRKSARSRRVSPPKADRQYVEAGTRPLELTRNMHRLFEKQQATEKTQFAEFPRVELGLEGRRNCASLAATL